MAKTVFTKTTSEHEDFLQTSHKFNIIFIGDAKNPGNRIRTSDLEIADGTQLQSPALPTELCPDMSEKKVRKIILYQLLTIKPKILSCLQRGSKLS